MDFSFLRGLHAVPGSVISMPEKEVEGSQRLFYGGSLLFKIPAAHHHLRCFRAEKISRAFVNPVIATYKILSRLPLR